LFLLYLASLMLRSLGVAGLAAIVSRRLRSVPAGHAAWSSVLVVMLIMPMIDIMLPPAWVPARVQEVVTEAVVVAPVIRSDADPRPVVGASGFVTPSAEDSIAWRAGVALYLIVALLMLADFAIAYGRIRNLSRTSRLIGVPILADVARAHRLRHLPKLRETSSITVPMTVGFLTPVVLLPADWRDWDEWKLRAVLSHELAHVRRSDWLFALIASFANCVFWFNPLSWWLKRHLSTLAEKASDEASLALTGDPVRYAEILLQFARTLQRGQRLHFGGVAMARKSMTSRIDRVLTLQFPGTGALSKMGWIVILILSLPVVYSASALHIAPSRVVSLPPIKVSAMSFERAPFPAESSKSEVALRTRVAQPIALVRPATAQESSTQGGIISTVPPTYPPLAKQARIQGIVVLSVDVTNGVLNDAQVVTGHPLLQQAAKESVRQWRFQGTGALTVQVVFRMDNNPNTSGLFTPSSQAFEQVREAERASWHSKLDALRRAEAQLRGTLSPQHPDWLRLQREIEFLESAIHSGERYPISGSSRPLNNGSYSFSFEGIQDRTIVFKGQGPVQTFSYGCENCSFMVYENGVGPVTNARGVIVKLSEDTKEMELTCQARECTVTSALPPSNTTYVQTLRSEASTKVSTTARVEITFLR